MKILALAFLVFYGLMLPKDMSQLCFSTLQNRKLLKQNLWDGKESSVFIGIRSLVWLMKVSH